MGVKVQSHPHPHLISSSHKLGSTFCLYHPFTRVVKNKGGGTVARRLPLPKGCAIVRTCRARLDQFSDNHLEDDRKNAAFMKIFENSRYNEEEEEDGSRNGSISKSSKLGCLRPAWLEIWPEPPNWPGRDEINQASIERKAVRFDIPVSLRMIKIKRKQQLEDQVVPASTVTNGEDPVYCSVKKAFASMVFIIRELQSYNFTLQKNEILYCHDLQRSLSRVRRELHASFLWLFQQVFSKTPTLMLYLMILLANFTAFSLMMDDTENAASISSMITAESESNTRSVTNYSERENHPSQSQPSFESLVFLINTSSATSPLPITLPSNLVAQMEMEMEEVKLWKSVVEEASRMGETLLNHDTNKRMVSPVLGVEVEADDYIEYHRTDLEYQIRISEDPKNPLLLCNYGHFLRLFARDQDRAEECFKRALEVEVEPQDGETLSRYANFLWIVRKDLWGAEERFLQAMAADPGNPYHLSNYATFLWNTGGGDICFPLQSF